eukprot:4900624-Alexandrium_andersonii.AAC.1
MPVARWRRGRCARGDGEGAWVAAGQEVAWRSSASARAVLTAWAEKRAEEIEQRAEAGQSAQRAAEEARATAVALAVAAEAAAAAPIRPGPGNAATRCGRRLAGAGRRQNAGGRNRAGGEAGVRPNGLFAKVRRALQTRPSRTEAA